MTTRADRARRAGFAALVVTLAGLVALATPALGAKKKGGGKKGGGTVSVTQAVNLPIPDKGPAVGGNPGQDGVLSSTIDVGTQFKGRRIRDINVTLQTGGTSGTTPADDLMATVTAPGGGRVLLFNRLFGPPLTSNPSLGPLTLDDEATLDLGEGSPVNPGNLYQPWAGAASPDVDSPGLFVLDNGTVRGAWTLTVSDVVNLGTSNLVSWSLNVVAGRPFRTK